MRIYISGPISGLLYEDVRDRFDRVERYFKNQGVEVVNPMKNGLPASAPWHEHMLRDLELLDGCDTIYMLDGWRKSKGALLEFAKAIEARKTIMFENVKV